jgi:photosystem II stability/assembly factor-like uncharacterized protein
MKTLFKFLFQLVVLSIFFFSCSKNNDAPVVQPVALDTLGVGWQAIKVDTTSSFTDIFFVNDKIGFLCGPRYLGKSTDGGLTWKKCIPDSLNAGFVNLFFVDANNGWAFGDGNYLLRTHDGGVTWEWINKRGTYDGIFFDANNGYVISTNNTTSTGLYKTSDGGVTLTFVAPSGSSAGLFFLDQNKGWFADTYLHKTENAGVSFATSSKLFNLPYIVQYTDDLHGWMAGYGGIYRTVDGGTTIEKIIDSKEGSDVQFFDNNNGYMMTGDGVYSTTDGGKTSIQLCKIHNKKLEECHFTDPDHGWLTGLSGYVYRYVKP